jgi:hypothetical protein
MVVRTLNLRLPVETDRTCQPRTFTPSRLHTHTRKGYCPVGTRWAQGGHKKSETRQFSMTLHDIRNHSDLRKRH